jgi:hypothetical protein
MLHSSIYNLNQLVHSNRYILLPFCQMFRGRMMTKNFAGLI